MTDPALATMPESAQLAAIVLLAKANVSDHLWARTTTAQLGQWLGYTESHIQHSVLPLLRGANVIESKRIVENGHVVGIKCRLIALKAAHAENTDSPLRLVRQDLAVLLRLLEALIGPGWAPPGGRLTPPGLLAEREGRGAATDRLALVLLVLRTRENGRVCLVGGAVAKKHGRAGSTVAKVLGCSAAGGKKVLARLVDAGVVETPRTRSKTGVLGRARLVVPAVAQAHRAAKLRRLGESPGSDNDPAFDLRRLSTSSNAPVGAGKVPMARRDVAGAVSHERPAGAFGVGTSDVETSGRVPSGVSEVSDEMFVELSQRPGTAAQHALHTPVVTDVIIGAGLGRGCSGSAGVGTSRHPQRMGVPEDQQTSMTPAKGPLRGEDPGDSQPLPTDLEAVLRPVSWLWSQVDKPSSRRWLADQFRRELDRMFGLAHAVPANRVLSERLRRRWRSQHGAVLDPVAWLLARGLPQRPWCPSPLCDEGWRIDTGHPCGSCEEHRLDSQGLRAWVTARMSANDVTVAQADLDRAVHKEVQVRAAAAQERHETQARRHAEQEQHLVLRRERARQARERWNAAPCAGCGMPSAAGRCPSCAFLATTEEMLTEAAQLAVAEERPSGPVEASVVREDLHRWREHLATRVDEEMAKLPGAAGAGAAYQRLQTAQRLRDQLRKRVLAGLAALPVARGEARRVRSCVLTEPYRFASMQELETAAAKASDQAAGKAAGILLASRLSTLRFAWADSKPRPGWQDRLSAMAARPLPGDGVGEPVMA